jgi:hypothetical protein
MLEDDDVTDDVRAEAIGVPLHACGAAGSAKRWWTAAVVPQCARPGGGRPRYG